jgi:putative PIN family toxin of toxin-antitoxin system
MRLVFDTNVIVSFLISHSSKEEVFYNALKLCKLDKIEIYYSSQTFNELLETIKMSKIQDKLNKNTSRFLADYKFLAKKAVVSITVDICRDPKDNKFLELSKTVKADYLITGDKDLLDLKEFEGTKILKPSEFLLELRMSS